MPYCPIQLKIKSKELKQKANFTSDYLLQVWTKGKKTYQVELRGPVALWRVWNEYLVYKPSTKDDRPNEYRIVNLNNNGVLYMPEAEEFKDPAFKHIGYFNSIFYIANAKELKAMKVPHSV